MAAPNATKRKLFESSIDYVNGTIECLLLDNSTVYTFDPDTHEFVSNVTTDGTEMSGTSYSRQTLSGTTTSVDATNDEAEWDANDTTFPSLNEGDIQSVVVYESVTDDTDSPVLAVFDDDSGTTVTDLPLSTNGGDITISWDTEGIKKIS
jgi:hypothetical protein